MAASAALFIVVEGKELDRAFYSSLAESSDHVRSRGYQIWPVEQITRSSGIPASGKKAVLKVYDSLRRRRQLTAANSSGSQSMVFCIDRDNDDLAQSLRTGSHVIYTETYDANSYIFYHGDVARALTSATWLDWVSISGFRQAVPNWFNDLALLWREWITLCCVAKAAKAPCYVGFAKPNVVNTDTYGALDVAKSAAAQAEIARRCTCSPADFTRIETRVRRRVSQIYSQGLHYRLVRGKWLPSYLKHLLQAHFGRSIVYNGLEGRLTTAFLGATDFHASWADYYRQRFESVLT